MPRPKNAIVPGAQIPLKRNKRGMSGGFEILKQVLVDKDDNKKRIYFRCKCTTCKKVCVKRKSDIVRGEIRCKCHGYYSTLEYEANKRGIEFSIPAKHMWKLLRKQKFRCALSNQPIYFNSRDDKSISLDRIDSSKGYTIDNVQWLHKSVNMMKQSMSQQEFIQLCKLVAFHSDKEPNENSQPKCK